MPKKHEHIHTILQSYDKETDMITARCECGSETTTARLAKNRTTTAWSAYPDKVDKVVKILVDQDRLEGDTMDETDGS